MNNNTSRATLLSFQSILEALVRELLPNESDDSERRRIKWKFETRNVAVGGMEPIVDTSGENHSSDFGIDFTTACSRYCLWICDVAMLSVEWNRSA